MARKHKTLNMLALTMLLFLFACQAQVDSPAGSPSLAPQNTQPEETRQPSKTTAPKLTETLAAITYPVLPLIEPYPSPEDVSPLSAYPYPIPSNAQTSMTSVAAVTSAPTPAPPISASEEILPTFRTSNPHQVTFLHLGAERGNHLLLNGTQVYQLAEYNQPVLTDEQNIQTFEHLKNPADGWRLGWFS